jgi:malonyl-CoA/methylmalonyl-CoA synthetase
MDLREDGNLPRRWARRWAERGDAVQLVDTDGARLSAGEVAERTARLAHGWRAEGLAAGDRLLVVAEPGVAFVLAYISALRAGLTVVPLNPAYPFEEATAIARQARPAAVAGDAERAGWVREATGDANLPAFALDDLPRTPRDAGELDAAATDDTALLIYTSGTTGAPKGVPLSHGNLLASATAVVSAWRWTAEDHLLLTLPLFHVHGLGVGLNGSLCAGAAVTLRPRFDAADVAGRCASGEPTLFFGVPTMYSRLLREGRAEALRGLRLLVSGSAPLAAEIAHELAAASGQVPLERYGMTETLMLTGNPYDGERRPGTVGFPFPGVELRLADGGEVEVRGPNVIAGYLERPDADAEAFTADGWFRTGDLGERDAEGYLRLVGRRKELIITGGYNVLPREVEEVLATHPAVGEVAVVGRPDADWGETVTAVVVAADAVDAAALRAYAAERLAPYKVPKRVEFADALPRNAMGKIVRGAL